MMLLIQSQNGGITKSENQFIFLQTRMQLDKLVNRHVL